ncbi:MAG: hypothetical protein AB7I35_08735 [Ramlibacter sp.]
MHPRRFLILLPLLAGSAIAGGPYLGTRPVPGSTSFRTIQEHVGHKRVQIGIAQFSVPSGWQAKSAVVGVNFVSASGEETNVLVLSHANARPRIADPQATVGQTLAHFCDAPSESRVELLDSNSAKDISAGYCKEKGTVQSKPYFLFFEVRTPTHMIHLIRERASDLQAAKSELRAVADSATFD